MSVDVVLKNTTNEASFDAIKGRFSRWRFYDNRVSRGSDPELVAARGLTAGEVVAALRGNNVQGELYFTDDREGVLRHLQLR